MTTLELLKCRLLKKLAEALNGEKVEVVMTASAKDMYVTLLRSGEKKDILRRSLSVRMDPKILNHSTKDALNGVWGELNKRGETFFKQEVPRE